MTNKIIIIDLEATCWEGIPPKGEVSEIIEIGICLLDTLTGEISDNRGILVKPTHSKISPFCTQLTTITPELVAWEGVSFEEALQILKKEYQAYQYTWASYGNYDRNMLQKQCALRKLPYPMRNEHINIKERFQEVTQHPKRLGMHQALNYLKIPLVGTHHRGKDDAYNIAKIMHHLSHYQSTNYYGKFKTQRERPTQVRIPE